MLTIFSVPKPFIGHTKTIQNNAIQSWCELLPPCEIILCGDEFGISEAASEFNVFHLSKIEKNDYGTPLLNDVFKKVADIAQYNILCYVNSDIILPSKLPQIVRRIKLNNYVLVGQRINLEINWEIDFSSQNWEANLFKLALCEGRIAAPNWIDYFIFTLEADLISLPPFIVGRPAWDNWFIFNALKSNIPVIDITRVCKVIHQNHSYVHIPDSEGDLWKGPEATRNKQISTAFMRGENYTFSILNADYFLSKGILLPALTPKYIHRKITSLHIFYPRLKFFVRIINAFISRVDLIQRRLSKLFRKTMKKFLQLFS